MLEGCTPWPDELARRYREAGAWRGTTLATLAENSARRFPGRTALVHGQRRISYSRLYEHVERLTSGLRDQGLVPGDKVMVQLPNIPEFVVVCLALFRIDAKPVLMLPGYRAGEVANICRRSEPAAYIVGDRLGFDIAALGPELIDSSPTLRRIYVVGTQDGTAAVTKPEAGIVALPDTALPDTALPDTALPDAPLPNTEGPRRNHPDPDPADVAFFLLSGGTTGAQKLIPRTHDDYLCQLRTFIDVVALDHSDVYLAILPAAFNFTFGCPGVLGTLYAGGTVVLSEEPDPFSCLRLVATEGVTAVALVPGLAQLWVDEQAIARVDTSSLRLLQVGGARLHRGLAAELVTAFGPCLQQTFGMAEGLLSITRAGDPSDVVLGTQGRPLSNLDEIRIVDEDGAELPPGRFGELEVQGPYTFRGYYRAPEQNATAFAADGFYRTGDLARVTAEGYLEVMGRRKDVVNRGGMKISAAELEEYLLAHEEIANVAVVPVPDPVLGQRVCACVDVVGERVPALAELKRHCLARGLAEHKLPEYVEVVTPLPLTPLGKIDKKALEVLVAEKVRSRSDEKETIA